MQMIDLVTGDNIVLTAGGTGGHMFPAQALAQALIDQGRQVTLITDKRGAHYVQLPKSVSVKVLDLQQVGRSGWLGKMLGTGQLLARFWDTSRWIRSEKPDQVIGFGGYPAFPTLLSAVINRVAISLHEQNGVMGRVNRMFIRWATQVGTSFPHTQRIQAKYNHKVFLTGMPIRASVAKAAGTAYAPPNRNEPFRILVLGGSQGAGVFSEVVPQAIANLSKAKQQSLHVVQQCRKEHTADTKRAYKSLATSFKLTEFIKDIGPELAKAHLVITRAGASTTAELLAIGRPAIFIPYPHATDDHQTANAKYAQSLGLGWVIPQERLTAEVLAQHIGELLAHPQHLIAAAQSAECR